jgi:hypothetical protein
MIRGLALSIGLSAKQLKQERPKQEKPKQEKP